MRSGLSRKFEEEREKHQVCGSQLEIKIHVHVFCVAQLSVGLGVEKGLPRLD